MAAKERTYRVEIIKNTFVEGEYKAAGEVIESCPESLAGELQLAQKARVPLPGKESVVKKKTAAA